MRRFNQVFVRCFILSGCVALLAGCASSVMIDRHAGADYASLHSYSLLPPEDKGGFVSLDNARIQKALTLALALEGLKPIEKSLADVWVAWRIEPDSRLEGMGYNFGFGLSTGHFGLGTTTPIRAQEIVEGKLVVELIKPADQQVIWRGAARRLLNEEMSPEKREQLINDLVTDMFAQYPPGISP